ncbi:MAG: hypothetical protein P8Y47_12050 [Alphaproteobacteria bacterium]
MKPFDDLSGYSKKTVPEMIQLLWALYADMVTDPALADSARQIRSVAEELERLREMARQVSLEDRYRGSRGKKRSTRRVKRQTQAREEATEWLRTVRTATPSKH